MIDFSKYYFDGQPLDKVFERLRKLGDSGHSDANYHKEYYQKNKKKIKKSSKEYRDLHKEDAKERQARFRAKNKIAMNEKSLEYYHKNKKKNGDQLA